MFLVGSTFVLFAFGIEISKYHWILFPVGYLGASLIFSKERFQINILWGLIILLSVFLFSLGVRHLYALNWDGMLGHKEFVMALQDGWNPVQDPYYQSGLDKSDWENAIILKKLEWGGYNVRFGYLFEAIIAKALGSTESGKGINLLMLIIPYLASLSLFSQFDIQGKWKQMIALGIALNPVSIVQLISFWEDIFFSCFSMTCILLAVSLSLKLQIKSIILFLLNLLLLMGVKRSGIAFAIVLIPVTLLAILLNGRLSPKTIILACGAAIFGIITVFSIGMLLGLWKSHGMMPYHMEQILSIGKIDHFFPEEFLKRIPVMSSFSGSFQLLMCSLSASSMVPLDVAIKFPFSVSKDELDVYYHIFTAPWFGGDGPFFGISTLLMIVFRFLFKGTCNRINLTLAYWSFFIVGILFFMPAFFPRWVPFVWLLPFFVFLSYDQVFSADSIIKQLNRISLIRFSYDSNVWRFFGVCMFGILILNASLVFGLNIAGHINTSSVLNQQLEFVETHLAKPVKIEFKDFPSNRDWFESKRIEYEPTEIKKGTLRMCLIRTNTYIDLSELNPDSPINIAGIEWSSLINWADSLNKRSGLRERWSAWIHPVVLILD